MSDERHPRPWRATDGRLGILDAEGNVVLLDAECRAALVGAVNAADPALPLEQVLANLAAGKVG